MVSRIDPEAPVGASNGLGFYVKGQKWCNAVLGVSGSCSQKAHLTPGVDFVEFDVGNGFQTPIDTCSLSVGECWSELLELCNMGKEKAGIKAVNSRAMFTIGRVGDRDVIEDGEVGAR